MNWKKIFFDYKKLWFKIPRTDCIKIDFQGKSILCVPGLITTHFLSIFSVKRGKIHEKNWKKKYKFKNPIFFLAQLVKWKSPQGLCFFEIFKSSELFFSKLEKNTPGLVELEDKSPLLTAKGPLVEQRKISQSGVKFNPVNRTTKI